MAIGKIARFDVPKDWPELLPALVQAVQVQDSLIQHRALLVLHHTIKALASKQNCNNFLRNRWKESSFLRV